MVYIILKFLVRHFDDDSWKVEQKKVTDAWKFA